MSTSAMMHPRHFAASSPDKPAYIMAGSGETVTYGELEARANRIAHWLRAQGVRAGDVVALLVENHPRVYELLWDAQRTGVHYLLVPTTLVASEAAYMIANSGAALAIISARIADKLGAGVADFACPVRPLEGGLLEELGDFPSTPMADEVPGADMLYSSGTTGLPKGIKGVRPADLGTPDRATLLGQAHFAYARDSVFLCPAPLYHAAPLRWSMAIHRLGGTVILMERFDAESALRLIADRAVSVAQFVPTHMARMLALPEEVKARYDLSSLKCIFHAGAPCAIPVKQAMIDWVGPIVSEFYSGSEGLGITIISATEWLGRPGSVGRAVQGTIKICGADEEVLPARQVGLVRFSGVRKFEYHGDPEKTASAYNKYGWPTLGDIGYLDEAGYLFLTDRANFTIISGGVNIYPREIEDRFAMHPSVADVAVVGLPHEEMGEVVTAFVEPRHWPVADEAELAARLDAHARSVLSAVKIPRRYVFRRSLGRTETGKLLKKAMRDDFVRNSGEFRSV